MPSWKNNNVLTSKRLVEEVLNPSRRVRESEKVVARDKNHLKRLIRERIDDFGYRCDLNDIDVSHVTDMSRLFDYSDFNGDISQWDVSNVTDMRNMFAYSEFKGDISNWNVSNVEDMDYMFNSSDFNEDISKWDVSNARPMWSVFNGSPLAGNEPGWYGPAR